MALDIAQTDLSQQIDLDYYGRTSSFPESYVRHSSTITASPPEYSPLAASQALPRSRPSDDGRTSRRHAILTRSPLSLTYHTAEDFSSQRSGSLDRRQLHRNPPGNDVRDSDDQSLAAPSAAFIRGPHQRGGGLSLHFYSGSHQMVDYTLSVAEDPQCAQHNSLSPSDFPSSPPRIHSPSTTFYSFSDQSDDHPIHSSPPTFSSPRLPSPYHSTFNGRSSLSSSSFLVPPSTSSSDFRQNASLLAPQESSIVDAMFRNPYRHHSPLPRAFRARSNTPPSPTRDSSPLSIPATRRSIRIYNDRLPASSQPQTPSRQETIPYNPAFTAPAGLGNQGYRYVSPISARRRMRRMERSRNTRSGSTGVSDWDSDDEEGENASLGVEAGRWIRRVMGSGQGRNEAEGERVQLERTPEREMRIGAAGTAEAV